MTNPKLKTKEVMRESVAVFARAEAASMSNWFGEFEAQEHPRRDAVQHYQDDHGLTSVIDPRQTRQRGDEIINEARWANVQRLCERYGVVLPVLGGGS